MKTPKPNNDQSELCALYAEHLIREIIDSEVKVKDTSGSAPMMYFHVQDKFVVEYLACYVEKWRGENGVEILADIMVGYGMSTNPLNVHLYTNVPPEYETDN